MSVLLRHPHTGEIMLYSKGADTTMLPSLSPCDENSVAVTSTRQYLQSYARQGLRTLVMARRTITSQEYETWRQKHNEAELSTENRERRIRDSYAMLESHLTLLGVTGIEDKLQAGVPETMAALVAAGIVVWVLTGSWRIATPTAFAQTGLSLMPTQRCVCAHIIFSSLDPRARSSRGERYARIEAFRIESQMNPSSLWIGLTPVCKLLHKLRYIKAVRGEKKTFSVCIRIME